MALTVHQKESQVKPPEQPEVVDALVVHDPPAELEVSRPAEEVLAEARKAAKALNDVIASKKNPVMFNGAQYLEFEDWQTLARFYGITAKVTGTRIIDIDGVKGYEAEAVAIHVPTGRTISRAEAMCMKDERNWSSKPLFQLKSMSQTRACAKALRNVLAWVVVLAGYKATPWEEMEGAAKDAPPSKNVTPTSTTSATTGGRPATEKQRGMLWAKCHSRSRDIGIAAEDIWHEALHHLGRGGKDDVLMEDVDKAVQFIESYDPTPLTKEDGVPF